MIILIIKGYIRQLKDKKFPDERNYSILFLLQKDQR